jgi:DNA-binding response OmpR family regulator
MIRASLCDVPIIVLTHLSRDLDELACIRGGADCFLRKPVNMDLLTAYVESNLRRGEGMRRFHPPQVDSTLTK